MKISEKLYLDSQKNKRQGAFRVKNKTINQRVTVNLPKNPIDCFNHTLQFVAKLCRKHKKTVDRDLVSFLDKFEKEILKERLHEI